MALRGTEWVRLLSARPQPPRTGIAYVAVRVVIYVAALVLIVLIYSSKARGLLMAPPVGLLCAAASWYLLGDTTIEPRRPVAWLLRHVRRDRVGRRRNARPACCARIRGRGRDWRRGRVGRVPAVEYVIVP